MEGYELGPLKVTAVLDLASKWSANVTQFEGDMKKGEIRGKELSTVFSAVGGSLNVVAEIAKDAAIAMGAFMTGAIATSPQFKEMMASLKPILLDFGMYLGDKLTPLFDKLVEGVGYFVQRFMEIDQKTGIMDQIANGGVRLLEILENIAKSEVFEKLAGLTSRVLDLTFNTVLGENSVFLKFLETVWNTAEPAIKFTLDVASIPEVTKWVMVGAAFMLGQPAIGIALAAAFGLEYGSKIVSGEAYKDVAQAGAGLKETIDQNYGSLSNFWTSTALHGSTVQERATGLIGTPLYMLTTQGGLGQLPDVAGTTIRVIVEDTFGRKEYSKTAYQLGRG